MQQQDSPAYAGFPPIMAGMMAAMQFSDPLTDMLFRWQDITAQGLLADCLKGVLFTALAYFAAVGLRRHYINYRRRLAGRLAGAGQADRQGDRP